MGDFRDERLFLGGGTPAGELKLLSVEVAESDFLKGKGEVYLGFTLPVKGAKAAKKKAEAEYILSLSSLLRLRMVISPKGEIETLDPNKGLKSLLVGCKTLGEGADRLNKLVGRTFKNTPINGVFLKKDGGRYAGSVAVLELKDDKPATK